MSIFRKTVTLLAIVAVCVVAAAPASAAITTTTNFILAQPSVHNEHFNDFSWEHQALDNDGDGLLSVGDVLEGVMDVESIGVQSGTLGIDRMGTGGVGEVEVTAYFRAVVTGVGMSGSNYVTQFGPDPTFEATYGTGAMAAFFEDATNNLNVTTVASGISTATDGIHLVTMGFAGLDGEGWESTAKTNNLALASLTAPGTSFGSFDANLNEITSVGFANDMAVLDIAFSKTSFFGNNSPTQFAVNGQLYGAASNTQFPLSNSADTFFQVVPEPSSIILWGALFGLVGLCGARRRK